MIEQISPLDPLILNILGSFLLLAMLLGVILNSHLLYIFKKYKDLQTPINTFIIAITVLNLLGTIFELPWIIHSCFSHKWTSGKFGCDLSSTIMFFIGCTSAYLMAAISFEIVFFCLFQNTFKSIIITVTSKVSKCKTKKLLKHVSKGISNL